MPDNELFRTIVQGGSFAVLVLILVWGIFRLEPRVRETMEKKDVLLSQTIQHTVTESNTAVKEMGQQFADTCKAMNSDNTQKLNAILTENRNLIDSIIKRHDEQILKLTQECREERKEWIATMVAEMELTRKRMEKEGDLNRQSRHEFANQIQHITHEVYQEGIEKGRKDEQDKQRASTR